MSDVIEWLDKNRRAIRATRGKAARSAVITRIYKSFTVDELWSACTERERLQRWFGDVTGELSVGSALRIDAGMPHPITSRVIACERPARIVITWSYAGDPLDPPDEVEARISAVPPSEGGGAQLEIEHRSGVLYPWASGVGSGWESWIWGLERALNVSAWPSTDRVRGAPDDVNAQIDARWRTLLEPAAQLTTTDDGKQSSLRFERKLSKPIEEVWRRVADFSCWYPARVELDGDGTLRTGAALRTIYEDGTALSGKIVRVTAPHLLSLVEENDALTIELRSEGMGTLLSFTHTFDAPGAPASFATGWDGCLGAMLHTGDAPFVPFDEAQRVALRAAYADMFATSP